MGYPCLQNQIVIDSTKKHIDIESEDGGVELVTAVEGTYIDIHALLAHLQTLLQAKGANWGATTVTVSATGIVTTDSNQSAKWVSILWDTGANTLTSMAGVLGYDNSADDTGAYSYAGDWQHMYGWYPQKWPAEFGPLEPEEIGGDQVDTLSGKYSKKVHVGFHYFYDIKYIDSRVHLHQPGHRGRHQ